MTVSEVVAYINAHLTDELQLVDTAKLAGYSPWHLCEQFKKSTGKSIMTYIREKRIQNALSEIMSDRRLFDIALEYGFETQAGFYKAFHAIVGCSPLAYKNHELRGKRRENTDLVNHIIIGGDFMEHVIIRTLKQTDAKDLWENIFSRNTPAEVEARIANNLEQMKKGEQVCYVAEADGVVIGNISLIRESHALYRHRCSLDDVVVNPAFQGMGIARELFETCKKYALGMGLKLITINVRGGTTAEEVYKHLGFIEAGRIPNGIVETWGSNLTYDDVFLYQNI
ncbi:MAG: GNAT family N-acetyltransferase [Oscillospiraceae bacterium]